MSDQGRGASGDPRSPPTITDQSSPSLPRSRHSTFPDGVKVWHDCLDPMIDVCFVHSLTRNQDSTWTTDREDALWPEMLLASKLLRARLLTYSYNAYIVRKSVVSANRLIDHITNLLVDLTNNRTVCHTSTYRLILVAHSLGGLVCKEAILLSHYNPDAHLCSIFECTTRIIFMGTPHRRS